MIRRIQPVCRGLLPIAGSADGGRVLAVGRDFSDSSHNCRAP
jgi:hypothetical protein